MERLRVGSYRKGRARADGALAPVAHFAGQEEWADPGGVLMVMEVSSCDEDTDRRDRCEKPSAYAAADIPVYLLVDPESGTVVVHTGPDEEAARYRDVPLRGEGEDPRARRGVEFETEILKNYAP